METMLEILFWIGFGLLVLSIIYFIRRPLVQKKHWQQFFDNYRMSSEKFYELVKTGLQEREIPGVKIGEETFSQKHFFAARMRYMRVSWNEYVFYIHSAPFGTGCFASWHLCIKEESWFNRIPLLSKLMGNQRDMKTFYQKDTEAMYRSVVHAVVTNAIDSIRATKGLRRLFDTEAVPEEATPEQA